MGSESQRLWVITQLCRIDPNGIYTDADSVREGYDPLTLEEAQEALNAFIYAQEAIDHDLAYSGYAE